jgi:hypothetical protein
MANPSTASYAAATGTVLDEAVRVANAGARRTTDAAQAALAISRRAYEQTSQLNKDLFDLWTTSLEAGLQSALDIQNATLATYQANVRLMQNSATK